MATSYLWLVVALQIACVFGQDIAKMVVEKGDRLHLKCDKDCLWEKYGEESINGTELDLGSLWDDPRGVYCRKFKKDNQEQRQYVHVYVRRCMNCIQLDPGTIAGFIVADVIMIGLIAVAVYFVSDSETRRPGRASDKQNLIERDSDYQMLGPRDDDHYRYLAPRAKRGGF